MMDESKENPTNSKTGAADTPGLKDSSEKRGANDTDPLITSEKPLPPNNAVNLKLNAEIRPIRNLRGLFLRENVDWLFILAGAKSAKIMAKMGDNAKDSKALVLDDDTGGGCLVVFHLSDNPEDLAAGFHEMSPNGELL